MPPQSRSAKSEMDFKLFSMQMDWVRLMSRTTRVTVGQGVTKSLSSPPGKFDKRDIDKLMKNDHLVNRYFVHVSELNSANAIENTVNMIVKALEWRKKTGIAGPN